MIENTEYPGQPGRRPHTGPLTIRQRLVRLWPWHRCLCACNRRHGQPCGPCRCGR